ncbi:Asp-tRNA(Asn)/Glu-tRNA(Gln) amidotransferase subunit GatB [bacterium]|jgi:aspartyl-tRNA(Asn)/glutamyl-tRNA(Gln) amidotransferase subunit B|nr:Asp-tRNA(Asn)/Glu-tRNA(Gln) amidotransferase subunit GatB [bacterium]
MSKTNSIIEKYPDYAVNIGIEVHVQLSTKSKIFCSCVNGMAKEPNKNICQICSGYPGVLPILNKAVVNNAILMGLATNSKINPSCSFARKHYFYPDLPKNYQISQSDIPICQEGFIPIKKEDGTIKKIRLVRVHMEEDAGKNIHSKISNESFVDLNRTGSPLIEIVSYPDIASTYEARAYLKMVHSIVQYLGIGSGNMEEGAFRADTNISVRKKDSQELGTRCELKNINSFKFICDAVEYEIERQIETLKRGEKIEQQTLTWDTKNKKSVSLRSKEEAADYRYFQEPDLPLLEINKDWIKRIKSHLPEMPIEKLERYQSRFNLSEYEAEILVGDLGLAKYFEEAAKHNKSKHVVNLILRDVIGFLKENKITINQFKIQPIHLAEIAQMLENEKINNRGAQEIFTQAAQSGKTPSELVKELGLEQIGSEDDLEKIVLDILKNNQRQVEQYKSGKTNIFGFFVGQAMQKTKGKGNPKILTKLLYKHLS